jgi:hypothetical protein
VSTAGFVEDGRSTFQPDEPVFFKKTTKIVKVSGFKNRKAYGEGAKNTKEV